MQADVVPWQFTDARLFCEWLDLDIRQRILDVEVRAANPFPNDFDWRIPQIGELGLEKAK